MSIRGKRVIIAGGGTGGHLFPAIAIGEILEKEGVKIKYIGSKNGIESSGKFINRDKEFVFEGNLLEFHSKKY